VALACAAIVVVAVSGCLPAAMPTPTSLAPSGITVRAEPPAFPGSVGATRWQVTAEPPPGLGREDTEHDELADAIATLVTQLRAGTPGAEVLAGLLGEPAADVAQAWVQVAGIDDDSVAGQELVVNLRLGPNGWYVAEATTRTHCRRGVSGDLCV
jgi:hypothetical protein